MPWAVSVKAWSRYYGALALSYYKQTAIRAFTAYCQVLRDHCGLYKWNRHLDSVAV